MPRPKGSKNKAPRKTTVPTADLASTIDLASLIADKSSAKEALTADIASLEENLTALKADLEAQKAEVEAREAEAAKKAELEETIQKLMADGMSAAEILEKLK